MGSLLSDDTQVKGDRLPASPRAFRLIASKIGRRLLLMTLALSLFPLLIASLAWSMQSNAVIERETQRTLTAIADGADAAILEYLNYLRSRTADFASDGFIRDSLQALGDGRRDDQDVVTALNEHLAVNKLPLFPECVELFVLDASGRVAAASTASHIGRVHSQSDVFLRGRLKPYVGDVFRRTDTHEVTWFVSAPVRSRDGRRFSGVLVCQLNPKSLSDVVTGLRAESVAATTHSVRLGQSGETYIVNRDGFMITESRFVDDAVLRLKVDTEPIRLAIESGREMTGQYTNYRSVPITGSSMLIRELGWVVLAEIDFRESFLPMARMRRRMVFFGVGLTFVLILAAVYFAGRLVKPLHALGAAADRMKTGDLSARAQVESDDEIGTLAVAFNRMAGALEGYTQDLEAQIHVRTVALAQTEVRIRAIVEGTASTVGAEFHDALVQTLSRALGTRWVMVGALGSGDQVEVLALWEGTRVVRGMTYPLGGTPCSDAVRDDFCIYEDDLAKRFPNDAMLRECGVRSYVGLTLRGADGKLLGILNAFHDGPLPEAARDVALLRVFGARAAVELERLRANAALRESEARTCAIVDNAADGIITIDEAGIVESFNASAERAFGYSADEVVGRNVRMLMPSPHREEHDGYLRSYRDTGVKKIIGTRTEILGARKDGSTFPAELHVSEIHIGNQWLFTAIVRDITERKQAEEALVRARHAAEAASQAKSDFLANMSHEIRTPMTAILGFAENLLDPDQSESDRLSGIHTIHRNGKNLLGIINDILDLSKIEAGKMGVERVVCEPCRIIAEVVSLVQVQPRGKGLSFGFEYIGAIPNVIQSDPIRLRQILINLIGNAIKFTEVGGVRLVIRFVDDTDGPRLQFDVMDTGRGMTEKQVGKVFQPFTQADTSTTREFGGTGLGLAISKRFAELLGGDVAVVETKVDGGTTIRVTVATGPLEGVRMLEDPMVATIVADAPAAVARVSTSDLHGLRILLAEDGPDNQRLISFILKRAGGDVTVKENGKLALDAALMARDEGNAFDLILMDMQMPEMDGYEATGLLRQKGYTGPIIALTAHAMESDREKCIKAGCTDYATKPIDRKKLTEMIQAHLGITALA